MIVPVGIAPEPVTDTASVTEAPTTADAGALSVTVGAAGLTTSDFAADTLLLKLVSP